MLFFASVAFSFIPPSIFAPKAEASKNSEGVPAMVNIVSVAPPDSIQALSIILFGAVINSSAISSLPASFSSLRSNAVSASKAAVILSWVIFWVWVVSRFRFVVSLLAAVVIVPLPIVAFVICSFWCPVFFIDVLASPVMYFLLFSFFFVLRLSNCRFAPLLWLVS